MRVRNPFLLRTAERINNDDEFIKLFSPKILDLIDKSIQGHSLWNQFFRFQSSPGGGKTSFLRLFNPSILTKIPEIAQSIDSNEDIDELYNKLVELGAISSDKKLDVLCVYNSCARDYSNIINLDLKDDKKKRLFLSLLNSRIIITYLRTVLDYLKIKKGDIDPSEELEKIAVEVSSDTMAPVDFPINCNGFELYKWCANLEKRIYREIDGFNRKVSEITQSTLFSVQLLEKNQIKYDGEQPLPQKVALMFDDVQKLALEQHKLLYNEIIEKRPSIGIWFAERLDLLSLDELWSDDPSTEGRDYVKEINLEKLFRAGKSYFSNFSKNVAQKRVERARDMNITSFSFASSLLQDINISDEVCDELISKTLNKIDQLSENTNLYKLWIQHIIKNTKLSKKEQLNELKYVQVLVERNEKKNQKELFSYPLTVEEFENKKGSIDTWIPEYLISREIDVPYYYGFDTLVKLSNSNIEQFLALSGRLFEEILSSRILQKSGRLKPEKQEAILKKEVEVRWQDINSISNHNKVKLLIESIANFCQAENNKHGFPYKGVTGIGLNLKDKQKLTDYINWPESPFYEEISQVLTVAIANNLIEVVPDRKQGYKGAPPKTLFYLNRWICLKYNLSLNYGGWRPIDLDTLGRWIKRGYKESDNISSSKMKNLYDDD